MDWKLVATTFVAIFIAELGDSASLGLIATTALGVLVGEAVTRAVPPEWINRAAGVLFIAIGAWTLIKS